MPNKDVGLDIRPHPAAFYDVDLVTKVRRGPLLPDDPAYPEAMRLDRSLYLDGVMIGYCTLKPGFPINLIPSRVLPKPSESDKAQIRAFVDSHMVDGKAGAIVNAPPVIEDEREARDDEPLEIDDTETEDDDE
jgi:hypothetical protein